MMLRCAVRARNVIFRPVFEFPLDDVHLSVRCFLVVPDRVRLSRPVRRWPRPWSRRVPAERAVFAFLQEASASFLTRSLRWYRLIATEISVPGANLKTQNVSLRIYFRSRPPRACFLAMRSSSRCAVSSPCLIVIVSPASDRGGLGRARAVYRRSVLFKWGLGWDLET